MVAPENSGWELALNYSETATGAARLASRMISGDIGLLEGLPELHQQLRELGEFDKGDFSGDFAALSFMLLDIEPYLPAAGGEANEQAARWVPTVVARHRLNVLEACRRVVARYAAQESTLKRA
ncbi:MAG TPA: hypothetical protein VD997_17970 [Phycisphaerales bacterium]|nr:hypothetical protein [Phycisphaerales bacterium]